MIEFTQLYQQTQAFLQSISTKTIEAFWVDTS